MILQTREDLHDFTKSHEDLHDFYKIMKIFMSLQNHEEIIPVATKILILLKYFFTSLQNHEDCKSHEDLHDFLQTHENIHEFAKS